ncbi:MAG TPA: amidase [Conexibacter sp.]|jgi:amidase|nr:amidase [Conexibacter sp.]
MSTDTELAGTSATTLARLIAERDVSAAEVVDAHLERISVINPSVNAVVQNAPDAREQARAADKALARGEQVGPLHGVPFTVKDNTETAGVITAAGAPERATVVPARDATVVARMRGAGAILLGKTNCPPWGSGVETDNELYGRTNNPHDLARTPGGSSGGEAAVVAAGGSPWGIGTDSGGSVRIPAHFCGVCALKPTQALLPITGVFDDEGPIGAISDPRTQVGPIARTVEDLGAMLRVLAGPDGHDGGVPPVALGDPAAIDVAGLRVAVHADNGIAAPTPETAAAVQSAAAALANAGAHLREQPLPGDGHGLTVQVWASYEGGMSSLDLYRLLRRWDAYRAEVLGFMAEHDVILCPVYPVPAPLHGGTAGAEMRAVELQDAISYTTPFSLVGAPCAVVPFGVSAEGLPIAVQVVARPWRDDVALAVAALLEAAPQRRIVAPAAVAAV